VKHSKLTGIKVEPDQRKTRAIARTPAEISFMR